MATNRDQRDNTPKSPSVSDWKDILTLKGYNELFERCENASDVFSCQEFLYNKYNLKNWISKLKSWKLTNSVSGFLDIRNLLFGEGKLTRHDDYVTLIQFYSLLENVFRNVLLRPYVPAYRAINKDCGLYRSFIQLYETRIPFTRLQFESNDSNLLIYKETDQAKTILHALTCNILCQYYIAKLQEFDGDQSNQQRRQN